MSWHAISGEARHDLEAIVARCVQYADGSLSEHGSFDPVAVNMRIDGDVRLIHGGTGTAEAVVTLLREGLEGSRQLWRAAGLCSHRFEDARLVVDVWVEHSEGAAGSVVIPFGTGIGSAEFGDLPWRDVDRWLWPAGLDLTEIEES